MCELFEVRKRRSPRIENVWQMPTREILFERVPSREFQVSQVSLRVFGS